MKILLTGLLLITTTFTFAQSLPEKVSEALGVELGKNYKVISTTCGSWLNDFLVDDKNIDRVSYVPYVEKFEGLLQRNYRRGRKCKWSRSLKVKTTRDSVEIKYKTSGCKMDGKNFTRFTRIGENRYAINSNTLRISPSYHEVKSCEFEIER